MGVQGTWENWKDDHIRTIENLKAQGAIKYKWSTANDAFVCSKCKERERVIFTELELLNLLNEEFCKPDDEDDRCRCVILACEFE